ncbi:sigma factor [Micromonospora arida]|uniref:sigma factor n=1 Tax=Micromonospora arida TaxID=2203715 RepID=UPI0036B1A27D
MTFEEYVGSRGPALVRLARLLTGDEHRAEDLTQEVLSRAYVHWRAPVRLTAMPAGAWPAGCEVTVTNFPAALDVSLVVNGSGFRSMEVRLQYARSIAGARTESNATAAGRPVYRYPQGGMMELLGIPKAHLTAGWGWPNKGFTEDDATTVLGGVQVAEHLDRPATW